MNPLGGISELDLGDSAETALNEFTQRCRIIVFRVFGGFRPHSLRILQVKVSFRMGPAPLSENRRKELALWMVGVWLGRIDRQGAVNKLKQ